MGVKKQLIPQWSDFTALIENSKKDEKRESKTPFLDAIVKCCHVPGHKSKKKSLNKKVKQRYLCRNLLYIYKIYLLVHENERKKEFEEKYT